MVLHLCMFLLLLSGSHLTLETSSESGGRRDTGVSLDSVGASSGSLSPPEPPSLMYPLDGRGREGSLNSEVFLNVLKLNQNRKRQEARFGTTPFSFFISTLGLFCGDKTCIFVVGGSLGVVKKPYRS